MRSVKFGILGLLVLGSLAAWWSLPAQGQMQSGSSNMATATDAKLRELHAEFVTRAETLALEYMQAGERAKTDNLKRAEFEKARIVAEQILRLVPKYPRAQQIVDRVKQYEANAGTVTFDVAADQNWQDTGVRLIEGKPVSLVAAGSWKFHMEHELTPDGMEIPKELRDFKLGSLIGIIYTGDLKDAKPFLIGSKREFDAEKSGRLFVKMHDSDPRDNEGSVTLKITGTFEADAKARRNTGS